MLGSFRFSLLRLVDLCKTIGHGPTLLHHPCVYVRAIREGTYGEDSFVFIKGPANAG